MEGQLQKIKEHDGRGIRRRTRNKGEKGKRSWKRKGAWREGRKGGTRGADHRTRASLEVRGIKRKSLGKRIDREDVGKKEHSRLTERNNEKRGKEERVRGKKNWNFGGRRFSICRQLRMALIRLVGCLH